MPRPPDEVCEVYSDLLSRCSISDQALAYGTSRGWDRKLLERLGITSIADPERLFADLLPEHGLEILLRAGLAAYPKNSKTDEPDKNRPPYFRFFKWPLVFPFISGRLRVEYLQARHFGPKPTNGRDDRWQNVGGPIPCLWNDVALDSLPSGAEVFLCEGIPDALSLVAHGFTAVASLGINNLRDDLVRQLLPFDVVIAGQRDPKGQGQKFAREAQARFLAYGRSARSKLPPEGVKDWNDFFVRRQHA